jgi:DNA-binding MarR family transcriptional regulator
MNKRFSLPGPYHWTRESAVPFREAIEHELEALETGRALVVDAQRVEVFDVSFAAEVFGRTLLMLPRLYPGRFLAVEHLKPSARENLLVTLERMNLPLIELVDGHIRLLGRFHPTDLETISALERFETPVAATELATELGLSINATNERLGKLVSLALVDRERVKSPAGREQFVYQTLH